MSNFQCLEGLRRFVPAAIPIHPTSVSEVMPMKILFKDEKYKDETIDILPQLMTHGNQSGDNQVSSNSDFTYMNIVWRQSEPDQKNRLAWPNEVLGMYM